MSANVARLALYHLVSAFEGDLRQLIEQFIAGAGRASDLLALEMYKRVDERAQADGWTADETQALSNLLGYLDFGDLIQICRRHFLLIPVENQDQLRQMQAQIDGLAPIRNRVMHGRPLEFDDLAQVLSLTEIFLKSPARWANLQQAATDISVRPEVLFGVTIPLVTDKELISHNLPLPDFDETGFIGRKENLRQLSTALKGVYPVITVVGEGGLGKTSLALKAAYDLLDSKDSGYDAIIFASAKTSQLTTTEIRRIEGAVNTSLGLMSAAVDALGGGSEKPVDDLLELLSSFKVLLILDNLETVIDENVRNLARGMPVGSKLLITSRIGLGAFEFPIVLQGLSSGESTQLLRASAKVSGVQRLVQMPDDRLRRFCETMRNNPLHIKWFVAAVRAGKRPEEILADERLFLKFCLSNVYEQLSEAARKVVRTLLSVGGANTTSEISYLSELDEISTIRAIQELLTTNMFIASSVATSNTFQTKYELSQLSRSYLSRFYGVAKEEQERLMRSKRQLISVGEQFVAESKKNPLSPYLIHCRDRSDTVPAKHLSDALRYMRSGDFDSAFEAVGKARTLAPEFYEVARVEAWLYAHSGSISEAVDAYERAVELAPDAPHVRLYFGGFLLGSVQDTELALPQFVEAHVLMPGQPEPAIELSRCHLYLKNYAEALHFANSVGSEDALSERVRRKLRDLKIQTYQRQAESFALELAPLQAFESLECLRNYCSTIDFFDQRMRQRIRSTLSTLGMIRSRLKAEQDFDARLDSYADWVYLNFDVQSKSVINNGAQSQDATFLRLANGGKFGFARLGDGSEVFIHETMLVDGQLMSFLQGDSLRLVVVRDDLGRLRGQDVRRV